MMRNLNTVNTVVVSLVCFALIFGCSLGCDEAPDKEPSRQNHPTTTSSAPGQSIPQVKETPVMTDESAPAQKNSKPRVVLETTKGNIVIELDSANAPITTANFLKYVEESFYDGLIFHRVIPGFMVQGGGFSTDMQQKKPHAPIKNSTVISLS